MTSAPSVADATYRELVDARFAYEQVRWNPGRISDLGQASQRLLRARQAMGSPRAHSAR